MNIQLQCSRCFIRFPVDLESQEIFTRFHLCRACIEDTASCPFCPGECECQPERYQHQEPASCETGS